MVYYINSNGIVWFGNILFYMQWCIILYANDMMLPNNVNLMILYHVVDLIIWYKLND